VDGAVGADRPTLCVGQQVAAGQTLVVAELVKTTHEVTAPAAGRVAGVAVGDAPPRTKA
jgi:biotin carboxyl carrier protein